VKMGKLVLFLGNFSIFFSFFLREKKNSYNFVAKRYLKLSYN
jgi:hypothetical protein